MVVYCSDLNQILSISTDRGSVHDFKIFKQSNIWKYKLIQNSKEKQFDLGFLGVKSYIKDAKLPHKQSKLHKLSKQQKLENKRLSTSRIKIENINREIKIFRICKETRRHKQKKHNLFWNLVGGIVNFKLVN
jgi:DDE superfamily endonuclease